MMIFFFYHHVYKFSDLFAGFVVILHLREQIKF